MNGSLLARYESALWWSMDHLGVTESVERKVLAAVGIQFGISLAQAVLPFLVSDLARIGLTAALLVASVVAFANTLLIGRRDITQPIKALDRAADAIANGDLDAPIPDAEQDDEIGHLVGSFADMRAYLRVVAEQAAALSRQEFDDPVMDEEVPGEFGASLDRMAESLHQYTTDLEATTDELETMTADLERRSENLRRLVTAFGDAAEDAESGDLTATTASTRPPRR